MSFILAGCEPGVSIEDVAERIRDRTGMLALTQAQFSWKTMVYFMQRTGIPVNFGITIALGFIIGAAVAGQTFFLFTLDNLKQFGALKAMGLSNRRLIGMVFTQAIVVGVLGYAIGFGLAAIAEEIIRAKVKGVPPAAYMAWFIPLGSAGAAALIVGGSSLFSLYRVLRLEPASVFR
jgi:putative ABC transport system permease protein